MNVIVYSFNDIDFATLRDMTNLLFMFFYIEVNSRELDVLQAK